MFILVLLMASGVTVDVAAYDKPLDCLMMVQHLATQGVESECVPT